jgi:hypothetical protein
LFGDDGFCNRRECLLSRRGEGNAARFETASRAEEVSEKFGDVG